MSIVQRCEFCEDQISTLGAYVKLSQKVYRHLSCHDAEIKRIGVQQGRQAVLEEIEASKSEAASRAFLDAKRQYEGAIRCLKCGIPMLSERPQALPAAFSTVTPSPSTAATCSACVRAEIGLRNAARQAPVAGTTASLMQPKAQAPEAPSTLIPGGRPIEID